MQTGYKILCDAWRGHKRQEKRLCALGSLCCALGAAFVVLLVFCSPGFWQGVQAANGVWLLGLGAACQIGCEKAQAKAQQIEARLWVLEAEALSRGLGVVLAKSSMKIAEKRGS